MTRYEISVCTGLTDAAIYRAFKNGDLHGKKDTSGRWFAEPGAVYEFALKYWDAGKHLMLPPSACLDYVVEVMAGKEHEPKRTRPARRT